jgi:hypothetical protein
MQSTESPILFRSCGRETPFSDQKGASKIGESHALVACCPKVLVACQPGFGMAERTIGNAVLKNFSKGVSTRFWLLSYQYLANNARLILMTFEICSG